MSQLPLVNRRDFLQTTSAALAGSVVGYSPLWAEADAKANQRINLGFIGVGVMGRYHLGSFLQKRQVQVVAVCDVVEERRRQAKKTVEDHYGRIKGKGAYRGCTAYQQFRDVLARTDIDAVVIATPDHWHAIPAVEAAQAKKHVYCEKPLTLAIAQGRKIVTAAKNNNIIFQTGSQQRTEFGGYFRTAVELVRNGRIGKVKTIRVGVGGPPIPCDLRTQPIPKGTNWDLWLGPAAKRGYNEILCPKGIHNHFPAWRNYVEYAGGGLADMGAHHFDIAQWALDMDNNGPVRIEPPKGNKTTGLKLIYANGVVMYHGGPSGCTFEGTEGTIYVDRGTLKSSPADIVKQPLGKKDKRVYHATNHHDNWLDCIRSKKQAICTAEVGHRSATVCHLANIGYFLRRPLRWDPVQEQFVDDKEANTWVDRKLREPWKL